jgi:3',5'-cyclic AMP phosphodiesterase CpdA
MFVLAHLSDPHLAPLPRPRASELFNKRVLGFANWHRGRKTIHRAEVLAELVRDLKTQNADHIAVTGDLVNLSLPAEFAAARDWLEELGPAKNVSFVPGNHDLYVRSAARGAESYWGEFMWGDTGPGFPFLRRRGPLAIIGLSSAVPTPPFMATGRLGPAQLKAFATLLDQLAGETLFRVVLIHHPVARNPGDRFKCLVDAAAFREILEAKGADLVLHGHEHVHMMTFFDGPQGRIPIVGVPSASANSGHGDLAAYNLYRIAPRDGRFVCEAVTRGLRRGHGGIFEITRRELLAA